MKAKFEFTVVILFSFAGCAALHHDVLTPTSKPATETVQITYHVIPGKEQELQRLLSAAWDVYRKDHLVFAQPHVVISDKEAGDKQRFVEIFTWVSSDAPDHAPAAVTTLWGQMQACCEARNGHQGLEGGPVSLVIPGLPGSAR